MTRSPAVARVGRSYRVYLNVSARLPIAEKGISQSDYSPIHAMATLLYQTLQSTLGHDTVIRRTWVTAAGRNFAIKITAKPVQILKLLWQYKYVVFCSLSCILLTQSKVVSHCHFFGPRSIKPDYSASNSSRAANADGVPFTSKLRATTTNIALLRAQ